MRKFVAVLALTVGFGLPAAATAVAACDSNAYPTYQQFYASDNWVYSGDRSQWGQCGDAIWNQPWGSPWQCFSRDSEPNSYWNGCHWYIDSYYTEATASGGRRSLYTMTSWFRGYFSVDGKGYR